MKRLILLAVYAIALILVSCEKDEEKNGNKQLKGVYIVNEGAFGSNNGSISLFSVADSTIYQDLFYIANNRPLGDVVQSMNIINNKGYIVVNGSGKIEVVDLETFKAVTEPLYFTYPRYVISAGDSCAYLSNGSGNGLIYIINTVNFQVTDSIIVGKGPETMVKIDNKVYVANSGGWERDSTISIIDVVSGTVTGNIVAGDIPIELETDADNNLWVHCKGYAQYSWEPPYDLISETDAYLMKINTTSQEILLKGKIGKGSDFAFTPIKMAAGKDKKTIYFMKSDGVYAIDKDATDIPEKALISGSFNGLEVNPLSGDIFVFEASYTGNGLMKIYSETGDLKLTYEVGIGPNGAVFNVE